MQNTVVSQTEWLAARKALLAKQKELTRARDRISAELRALPWVQVDKNYVFDTTGGKSRWPTCSADAANSSSITSCGGLISTMVASAVHSCATISTVLICICRTTM